MAQNSLQNVFDAARGYLHDTAVAGGEVWVNSALQVHFAEPYRRMFRCLMGMSKRVQRVVYVNLPANQTVLIPSTVNLTDLAEPEIVEERPASTTVTITSTTNATPISVLATGHGFGTAGQVVEVIISGVASTTAPWGQWFATITDANNFTLNGSTGDGTGGTGGTATLSGSLKFTEVSPLDLAGQGLDGQPQQYLGNYLWINEMFQFRGASNAVQLRITYWASGNPPTNANTTIGIDDCLDFLACATAANAARANGWFQLADQLKFTAYGAEQEANGMGGLLGEFVKIQVSSLQRGPQRRRLPFRNKRPRFGSYVSSA